MSLESENSPQGEQLLIRGVPPVSLSQRLEARMQAPLLPRRPQKPLDLGLWDEGARRQMELF